MKLLLAAIAVCLGLAGMIALAAVGFAPRQPSGPHGVRHEVAQIEITGTSALDGTTSRLPIEIGLWLPDKEVAPRSLPLVVYAPGWGGRFDDNTVLLSGIASHGYGVVAIPDIAQGPRPPWYTADDDAARLATFDISTPERQVQFVEDADRRAGLAAERVRHVLDAISSRQSRDTRFDLFNLDVVGAVGASFGGATVAEAALTNGRFGVVINLDGLVFGRAARDLIPRPYLEFGSSIGVVPAGEIHSTNPVRRFLAATNAQQMGRLERQQRARIDAFDITIGGTRHQDFTDALYGWSRLWSWRPWRERMMRPARVRYIVDTLIVAALDEWIRQRYGRFTRDGRAAFPEIVVRGGER